jgi:Protein of unknown function (DUF2891)
MTSLCRLLVVVAAIMASEPHIRAQGGDGAVKTRAAVSPGITHSAGDMSALLHSLPDVKAAPFGEREALAIAAMPLACIDHPQARSETKPYLYETTMHLLDTYDKTRVFYGCSDWHSAANSTWAMIKILKAFPKIPVAPLIREKLENHLDTPNVLGEMEFFNDAKAFERPYGYAWALKIYAELSTWDDDKGKVWANNVAPLARQLAEKLVDYFKKLPYPMRIGMHPNTAFCLSLLIDYANATKDVGFKAVLVDTAMRFFANDVDCPTDYEPSGSDFLSPCLAEAELMTKVFDQDRFVHWFDTFMAAPQSNRFKSLLAPVAVGKDDDELKRINLMGDKSHLIGLAFSRAAMMNAIADKLPSGDARVSVYKRLAAIHATQGFTRLGDAGYTGSHWFGAYVLMYALNERY